MTGSASPAAPDPRTSVPPGRSRIDPRRLALPALLGLGLLVPGFLAANLVFRFGVDVPYWDQWELVPSLVHLRAGTLGWTELFAQHNEHRILFPRLVMLGLASLTGWDTRAEMWVSWALLAGVALTLLLEHLRQVGTSLPALWVFLPVPWLVFALRQSENLLWGWQLQVPLAALGAVAALAALGREGAPWLVMAAVAAIVASFSFAAGLAVWPAGLVVLASRPGTWRRRLGPVAIWIGVALLTLAAYLHGYGRPAAHPDSRLVLEHLGASTHFLLAVSGAGLTPRSSPRGAMMVGAVLVVVATVLAFSVLRRQTRPEQACLGLGLLVFGVGVIGMVTLGRAGFEEGRQDLQLALTSRYTTLTLLGVCGLHRLALSLRAPPLRAVASGGVACLVALGTALTLQGEFREGAITRNDRRAMQRTLYAYPTAMDAELARLYPHPAVLRERAAELDRLGLSIFRMRSR